MHVSGFFLIKYSDQAFPCSQTTQMLLQCVSISEHRIQYSRVLKSRRNSVVMNIHLEDLMGDTDLTDYLKDYKITQAMFELPRPKW